MIYAIAFISIVLQGCDSSLAALFTPIRPELGRYEVCATSQTIEQAIAGRDGSGEGARYSAPAPAEPLDAFGAAGSYDRGKLARLYGGARPRVSRGWRRSGRQFESLTLISPYPDASLEHLQPGTLLIRWIIQDDQP
jgi:hypothetical protein